jgi:hypothetical protein
MTTTTDKPRVRWGRGCTGLGRPYILYGAGNRDGHRQITAPDWKWSVERQNTWLEGFAACAKVQAANEERS